MGEVVVSISGLVTIISSQLGNGSEESQESVLNLMESNCYYFNQSKSG